jgi:tetratricopeptide (TPR) repeat protein
LTELQRAIELRPELPHAYTHLVPACKLAKQPERAVALLNRAIERRPGTAALHRARAQAHLGCDDIDAALRDFEEAIRLEENAAGGMAGERVPAAAGDHLERAFLLYGERRYQDVVEACKAALEAQRDLVVAHRLAGMALLRLQRYDDAGRAFDRYLERGKPAVGVFRARAQANLLLAQQGRPEHAGQRFGAAVLDYTHALTLAPDDPELLAARGWVHLAAGAPQPALADFDCVLKLWPADADAWNGRGYALVKQGKYRRAIEAAETALRHGPRSQRLLLNAARIHAQAVAAFLDAPDQTGRAAQETLFLFRSTAVGLLEECLLKHTRAGERTALWTGQVHPDVAFNPIRDVPEFARLAASYSRAGK